MSKINNILTPILALALIFLLIGCSDNSANDSNNSNKSGNAPPIFFEDTEKLVKLKIEDGEASISFNLKNWEKLFEDEGGYEAVEDFTAMNGGYYPIETLDNEKVVAACIGRVNDLDYISYTGFAFPSVILLKEDGTLEWLLADPFLFEHSERVFSFSKLPWLKDIVALSYETETEGFGEMTIIATDKAGLHYDVRIPHSFMDVFDGVWVTELNEDPSTPPSLSGILRFYENAEASFVKRWSSEDMGEISYTGQYKMFLDEESSEGWRAGMIALDLSLDSASTGLTNDIPEEIKGVFFANVNHGSSLYLYTGEGDPLHYYDSGQAVEFYEFSLNYAMTLPKDIELMDEDELVKYMISVVPEAKKYVEESGMATLVTGETTFFPVEGQCRDIWLGTNHKGKFTREILYSVSPLGNAYRYDPIGDGWEMVNFFN